MRKGRREGREGRKEEWEGGREGKVGVKWENNMGKEVLLKFTCNNLTEAEVV